MRLQRTLLAGIGLLAIGGITGCATAAAANTVNRDQSTIGVSIEVSPNRTTAGMAVTVRANCPDNSMTATISSPAFGTFTATRPSVTSSLLQAAVTIPGTVQPGSFTVTVTCTSGASATTKLTIVPANSAQPTVGPNTGGGYLASALDDGNDAAPWLLGGVATLALAGAVKGVSIHRRRRAVRRARTTDRQPPNGDDDRFVTTAGR
jgi:hypothetical protein